MNIYESKPYFYIIEDVRNGKQYAGSRWAKGCHPDELLREKKGYYTSSKEVKKIIKEYGLNTFKIIKIETYTNKKEVYEVETNHLLKINAADNKKYYNKHNNDYRSLKYKGNREIVNIIKHYSEHYNFKLKMFNLIGGWWQKPDTELEYTLERIILAFGEIK